MLVDLAAEKLAVAANSLTVTDGATKKPVTLTGSYVTIYKKQPDGSWKAVEDIATPTLPPTAPAAPSKTG